MLWTVSTVRLCWHAIHLTPSSDSPPQSYIWNGLCISTLTFFPLCPSCTRTLENDNNGSLGPSWNKDHCQHSKTKSKHNVNVERNTHLIWWYMTCTFSGQAPFLNQQNNSYMVKKWKCTDPVIVTVCSKCLEECWHMEHTKTETGNVHFHSSPLNWFVA